MELKDIKAVIDLMKKNDLSVFEMEKDGFKPQTAKGRAATNRFQPACGSSAPPAAAAPASAAGSSGERRGGEKAPRSRTSCRRWSARFTGPNSPESPPFVDIGKEVTEETVVCIIEAMKVMNEIKAETKGVIAEIVAENGKPVQFGQVLFRVK